MLFGQIPADSVVTVLSVIIGGWIIWNRTGKIHGQEQAKRAVLDERIENRLNSIDTKLAEWKTSKDHIYEQFEKQDKRFDEMDKKQDKRFDEMDKRIDDINTQIVARLFEVTTRKD